MSAKLTTAEWYASHTDAAPDQEYEGAHVKKFYICRNGQGHPDYLTTPSSYKSGSRCPKCNGRNKLTTEEWYKRDADAALGQEYEGGNVKKFYICQGSFGHPDYYMIPDAYQSGQRCPLQPCNPWGKTYRPPFTLKSIQPRYEFLDGPSTLSVMSGT